MGRLYRIRPLKWQDPDPDSGQTWSECDRYVITPHREKFYFGSSTANADAEADSIEEAKQRCQEELVEDLEFELESVEMPGLIIPLVLWKEMETTLDECRRHFRILSKVDQSVVWDAMCDEISKVLKNAAKIGDSK